MNANGKTLSLEEILKVTSSQDWEEAVVTLGYGDDLGLEDGILDFTVRLHTPEQVYRIISQVGEYNNFDGEKIAEVLAELLAKNVLMYVEFGRAGSPVLFVYLREPETMKPLVRELLEKFKPDELDDYGPWAFRAWWD